MKTVVTLFFAFAVAFFHQAHACSCIAIPDNFCESIVDPNGDIWEDFHIYHVKVEEKSNDGIEVSILKTFHGDDLTGENIFVVNGIEVDCRISTDGFSVGDEHIFAVFFFDGIWGLHYCGLTHLKVEDNMITGGVAPGIPEIPYEEFTQLENCGDLDGTSSTGEQLFRSIRVQPSLTSSFVSVETTQSGKVFNLELKVLDAFGRLVFQTREPYFGENSLLKVDVQGWSSGVYFLQIATLNRKKTVRVVKVE